MGKKEIDFERDLSIDKFRLDEECITHPGLFYRYSEMAAEAKNKVGVLGDSLKLTMGEANIKIRNRFIKAEEKFTEAVISSSVEKDEDVITAREELREAELALARLQAGVNAMEHRKSQLDNLVKLYVAGYFSTPAQSGRPKEAINDQAAREARRRLNSKRQAVQDDEE